LAVGRKRAVGGVLIVCVAPAELELVQQFERGRTDIEDSKLRLKRGVPGYRCRFVHPNAIRVGKTQVVDRAADIG
jgi:hypothetical protein